LLWTAIGITFHGCVLAPLTMLAVLLAGGAMPLIMLVVVAMGIPLVANLAALPTRITIPAFILSLAIDAGVLVACVVLGPGQVNIF